MAMNKDTFEGSFDEGIGKVENAAGQIFGDKSTQAEGTIHELKGKAEQAFGKAKDSYSKASDKAREWADQAPEAVRQARDTAARLADESTTKVRQTVQEQPIAVLAGGIALGFVIGWLISGNGSRNRN